MMFYNEHYIEKLFADNTFKNFIFYLEITVVPHKTLFATFEHRIFNQIWLQKTQTSIKIQMHSMLETNKIRPKQKY